MARMDTISRKICLLGDCGVGKTSLIRQFVDRQFSDRYLSTVGVKISGKTLTWPEVKIQLIIWDLEGQAKFYRIGQHYLQGAMGACVAVDSTRPETFSGLSQHIQRFGQVNPEASIVVAFNKADLCDRAELDQVIQKFQPKNNPKILGTYPTSAKTGENVDVMFKTLAFDLVKNDSPQNLHHR